MKPLISIIVPCYNQVYYLSEALQSVLDQTYTDWECIIVNDSSPDNTEEIAKEWAVKDNRFKYFLKPNSGVSDTRNFGIKQSLGTYILPLDGDDKISKTYLEEAVNVFEKYPETTIVYSNQFLFGKKNEKITLPPFQFEKMFIRNQIFNSAFFKRSDFDKTIGYNTNMAEGLEDWDFWLSILDDNSKVVKLDGFHYYYRIKDISRSTLIDREKNERLLLQIFRNHTSLFLRHFNPLRDHIEADQFKKEVIWLKEQPEYRIGKFIYAPIKYLKKGLRRIFG